MIIIKAGGSAITDKSVPLSVKKDMVETLARALKGQDEKIIVCHGGGSFGHPLALEYGIIGKVASDAQLSGIPKIHVAMRMLSNFVCDSLSDGGCRPFSVQTSSVITSTKGRISTFDTTVLQELLERGFIPVIYGDAVIDHEYGFAIMSGDQIMQAIAERLDVTRAIFLTDIDGIYTADPKKSDAAELIRETTLAGLRDIDAGTTGDITGGMKGKIREIARFEGLCDEVIVCNISSEKSIRDAIAGKNPGTRIFLR